MGAHEAKCSHLVPCYLPPLRLSLLSIMGLDQMLVMRETQPPCPVIAPRVKERRGDNADFSWRVLLLQT